MDCLPQELITHIASFIEREDNQSDVDLLQREKTVSKLPPYATLSRPWQLAIESRTFKTLSLKSSELPYFAQLLTYHRRHFLSHLAYTILLPTYSDNRCAKYETEQEMDQNSQAFTDAIHALFQLLKTWESDDAGKRSATFSLDLSHIYSLMDKPHRLLKKDSEERWRYELNRPHDLWEQRYEHSFLRLLEHQTLPNLSCVNAVCLSVTSRHIVPESSAILAAKLSNVESVTLTVIDNEKKRMDIRQQSRHEFALALPLLSKGSLRSFTLNSHYNDPMNEYYSPPSTLLPSAPSTDHLSRALHAISLSPNLTSFTLNPIVISSDLFWPLDSPTSPTWPHLRQCHVEFNLMAPDGTWYFRRDPAKPEEEEGDDDERYYDEIDAEQGNDTDSDPGSYDSLCWDSFHERQEGRLTGDYPTRSFRTLPSDTHINPLLLAMARAAAHMPQLQSMTLTSTMHDPNGPGFNVYFSAPANPSNYDAEPRDAEKARLEWDVGSWRPHEEVLDVWRAGKEDLLIKFIEWNMVPSEFDDRYKHMDGTWKVTVC
ncbi:MAG: hypothetical protein Q9216_006581 [Gyalolechia sp. 2 TL-2023]